MTIKWRSIRQRGRAVLEGECHAKTWDEFDRALIPIWKRCFREIAKRTKDIAAIKRPILVCSALPDTGRITFGIVNRRNDPVDAVIVQVFFLLIFEKYAELPDAVENERRFQVEHRRLIQRMFSPLAKTLTMRSIKRDFALSGISREMLILGQEFYDAEPRKRLGTLRRAKQQVGSKSSG